MTLSTRVQLISGGATIVIVSLGDIALLIVNLIFICVVLPISLFEKVAVGYSAKAGVNPLIRLLFETSMLSPFVTRLFVANVIPVKGCVVGGFLKGYRVKVNGELVGAVLKLNTEMVMLLRLVL
jgi:hypothetical protein